MTMERPDGLRGIVYRAPKKSEAALAQSVRARLLDGVPKAVERLQASEPAFCLALVYDPASLLSMLPPKLAVGLESGMEGVEPIHLSHTGEGKPLIESLWDAQSFRTFDSPKLEFADKATSVRDTSALAEHFRSGHAEGKAREMLIETCKALNKVRWRDHLHVTPDFVVYPVDLETVHLREDIAPRGTGARDIETKAQRDAVRVVRAGPSARTRAPTSAVSTCE